MTSADGLYSLPSPATLELDTTLSYQFLVQIKRDLRHDAFLCITYLENSLKWSMC